MPKALDSKRGILRFSDFEVDLHAGHLQKGGRRVSLREQSFAVLAALLDRPGEVVTREELRKRLWPEDVFVDFDNSLNTAIARLREGLGDSAEHPRLIETLPKRGYRFIGKLVAEAGGRKKTRLAVLPFANLSGDAAQEYFCDGMTEEIIGQLAVLAPEHLSVIARTTSMHFKGTQREVAQIGEELNLDYVLEGSVRREGERVRISAQLIQVSDQSHVWAKTYDADLRHVLSLQADVARSIAAQIRIALPEAGIAGKVVDPQGHDAYLRGLYHLSKQDPAGLRSGAECFEVAIQQDPQYAAGYAKLALCHALAGYFGYTLPEVYPQAERAARMALELDRNSSDAYSAMGVVHWLYTWDLPGAERNFDRAIELNPNDPQSRMVRATFLATIPEDHAAAAADMDLARALDPLSMQIRINEGWLLYWSRQYDRAMAHARKTIELDENCVQAHGMLGLAAIAAGVPDQAVAALEVAGPRFGDPLSVSWLGMAYAMAGEAKKARAILRRFEGSMVAGYVPLVCPAWVHLGLGERQEALDLIEKAYDAHDAMLLILRVSPSFDTLREEGRYQRLIARLNLPETSAVRS
ncbi:MAG: winged helix-turn-helix domain-containing tetratricopeptide repeat protein [Bryobacteraceae bacterium]